MKLTIHQDLAVHETEIIINCAHVDGRLRHLIELIRQHGFSLTGYQEGKEYQIPLEQIYFMDSADGKTFLLVLFVWLTACQLIDTLISRIEFRKWSHHCIAESVVLYLLSLFISRTFFWKGMDVSIFLSFTVIFLFTDGFIFWYFRKRQEIQAEEINELIRAREENGPDCARNF